jgi:Raf kinase inhibitor-like YbhB/YbcL family protein
MTPTLWLGTRNVRLLAAAIIFWFGCVLVAAAAGQKLQISSSAFAEGGTIPDKFSRTGQNVNPPLRIGGVPAEAKSLAVMVEDPDAPGGVFTHWLVWNIDPNTTEIAENRVPGGGTQGTNDFSNEHYDGPQPPSGTHRYYFKVFALNCRLDLRAGAPRKQLDGAMKGHIVAEGELIGRYSRK